MKDQNGEEALEAKEAFEAYSVAHRIEVKSYHTDNGIFACAQWKEHCFKSHQLLTYAAVGAHQQNGKAKRRICTLQDHTRCMLIHAIHRWSGAVTTNLWPYTLREATEVLNNTNSTQHSYKTTPYQVFTRSKVDPIPRFRQPVVKPTFTSSIAYE
jgi:hypothetical protein